MDHASVVFAKHSMFDLLPCLFCVCEILCTADSLCECQCYEHVIWSDRGKKKQELHCDFNEVFV